MKRDVIDLVVDVMAILAGVAFGIGITLRAVCRYFRKVGLAHV